MGLDEMNLLGKNSYSTIVKEIYEKIQKAQCDTLTGEDLLKDVYSKLNESSTPMMELREFTTGAEQIAGDDVKLSELVKFIRKRVDGGDLNFIINLCKEEHFKNLRKLNHPAPEQTVKEIEEEFNNPSSVIEEGIKAGMFDTLKSDLLNKVKKDIKATDLSESGPVYKNSLVKYSPVGIKMEDIPNNRVVYMMESEVLSFDRDKKDFVCLDESTIDVPATHTRLMTAVNSCKYDPAVNTFSLNENWDFDLRLKPNGETLINGQTIKHEHIKGLLLESVKVYTQDPTKVDNFVRKNYLQDADNFIMLMENSNNLIKFDKLTMIKNLNENGYLLFDNSGVFESNEPRLIASTNNKNKLFESYQEMLEVCNKDLSEDISDLFESQLNNEQKLYSEKNQNIQKLYEEQQELNSNIEKVRSLKTIAEDDSPSMTKLNEQEQSLDKKLDENLKNLNFYKNEFKLY